MPGGERDNATSGRGADASGWRQMMLESRGVNDIKSLRDEQEMDKVDRNGKAPSLSWLIQKTTSSDSSFITKNAL